MKTKWRKFIDKMLETNYKEVFALFFLLSVSFYNILTGFFLMTSGDKIVEKSRTYQLMDNLMTIDTWGLLFILSAVLILIASFQESNARFINLILGGGIGAIVLFLYSAASSESAATNLLPSRYALSACFNLFVATMGGLELWKTKRKK
ncbi:hypothetical protein [Listeria marthii]|uniref:hypothetical protein n=1 Tax=Listeria marthii TaxID=529731 RepID=UPI00162A2B65|nr:hypothetical protein [Listeria marthii]MBC2038355.1 hypothetical protein [Listeria marthii]